MTCKLVKDIKPKTIPMCELPGGKLAVIVGTMDNGRIVQRDTSSPDFVILGADGVDYKRSNGFSANCGLKVRILEEGELIEVKYS